MKAAVIGHPISHSKSPIIHNYWLNKHGIEGSYETIDIAPDDLETGIRQIIEENYNGFNVTVPHKQAIIKLCDEIDQTAQQIGAVNTVTIKDGKLIGSNTDAYGFIQNLKTECPNFNDKTALVLGAGGASRAILHGLIGEGIEAIKLTNRTRENAEELSKIASKKIEVIDWNQKEQVLENVDLVINSTSLGMEGKPPLEINLSTLPKTAIVNDIVYAPLITDLLKHAETNGNKIVTGIGMLLHQARPTFQSWTGVLPEVTQDLEQKVLL